VAQGDTAEARRLLDRALPLARASMVAKHLLHRAFGTMIRAAAGPDEARGVVDRADSTLGWDDFCQFCELREGRSPRSRTEGHNVTPVFHASQVMIPNDLGGLP
jgi:hypothetical protein